MSDAAIIEVVSLAKLFLSGYFQAAKMAGLTEEQSQALFEEEDKKFRQNTPDQLAEV